MGSSPVSGSRSATICVTSIRADGDAIAAHAQQLGGSTDLRGQHVDVDRVVLDLLEDALELGESIAVADLGLRGWGGGLSHRGPP